MPEEKVLFLTNYVVHGGKPLFGEVEISGAKNAAVAILPAALLVDGVCRIENIPQISDVTLFLKILEELGAGIRTILDELYAVREKVRTYYLIDNLEFLIKGGRVSPLKGGIASKLRIKPIVAIKNGEGSIPANAMGYQNGLSKLAHFFWEDCTPDSELYVSHAGCPEKAMAIVEKIRERYHNLKYYIYPMLGTMSTQSGPDSIGIFYTKNK